MRALRVVLLGPPGSGKGTQARRLADQFGWTALSSGDVLRNEVALGSEVGESAADYMQRGVLVPDEVITRVMLAAIDRLPAGDGFVLDGFPRTLRQAEALAAGFAERKLAIDAVLDFALADAEITRRIVDRRVCSGCARTYNVSFAAPRTEGICDACGAVLTQRSDDRRDVVATRLDTYRRQTAPLIEFYRRSGRYFGLDAAASPDEVQRHVIAALRNLDEAR